MAFDGIQQEHSFENLEQSQETVEVAHQVSPGQYEEIHKMTADLMEQLQSVPEGDLVAEILDTAVKLLRDKTNRGDIKLINKSMKEIRYALRIFAPYREKRKVSIFGSARTPESDPDYIQAAEFARNLPSRDGW